MDDMRVKEKYGINQLSGASGLLKVGYSRGVYAKTHKKNVCAVMFYIGRRVCASCSPLIGKSFAIIQNWVELQNGLLFVSTDFLHVI
jgi:hypothetical protein